MFKNFTEFLNRTCLPHMARSLFRKVKLCVAWIKIFKTQQLWWDLIFKNMTIICFRTLTKPTEVQAGEKNGSFSFVAIFKKKWLPNMLFFSDEIYFVDLLFSLPLRIIPWQSDFIPDAVKKNLYTGWHRLKIL